MARYPYGKCMRGHVSTTEDWNKATAEEFKLDINKMETIEKTSKNAKRHSISVQYNTFVCPVCKLYHSYDEIIRMGSPEEIK